jgi:hypothetical protein
MPRIPICGTYMYAANVALWLNHFLQPLVYHILFYLPIFMIQICEECDVRVGFTSLVFVTNWFLYIPYTVLCIYPPVGSFLESLSSASPVALYEFTWVLLTVDDTFFITGRFTFVLLSQLCFYLFTSLS